MIGTVLLVAIVALLATTGAYVVFGLTEEREPGPGVDLELEASNAPAGYELVHENGETLDGEKVELRGVADENALVKRDLLAGDSVTIFPTREQVQLVWLGEHGSSYVFEEFETDPGVPAADDGCSWLSGKTTADIDLVLHCDVTLSGDVDLESGGTVIGRVESQSNSVDIDNGGLTVYGPVVAGDDIAVDGSRIAGDVRGTDVDLDDSVVHGSVVSTGPVTLDGVTVEGDVYASNGSLSCTDSPTISDQSCSSYTPKDPDDY